jgi:Uma2 family endonuclease
MTALQQLYRLSADDFVAMARSGILAESDHVELVEGQIVSMAATHTPHARVHFRLSFQLASAAQRAGIRLDCLTQPMLRLDEFTVREPDLLVLKPGATPGPAVRAGECALVIEIADHSLSLDLGPKARDYAVAGIAAYWVVDVSARQVHAHQEPVGERYQRVDLLPFGVSAPFALVGAVDLIDLD